MCIVQIVFFRLLLKYVYCLPSKHRVRVERRREKHELYIFEFIGSSDIDWPCAYCTNAVNGHCDIFALTTFFSFFFSFIRLLWTLILAKDLFLSFELCNEWTIGKHVNTVEMKPIFAISNTNLNALFVVAKFNKKKKISFFQ